MQPATPTTTLELRLAGMMSAAGVLAAAGRSATGGSGLIDLPRASAILEAIVGMGATQDAALSGDIGSFEAALSTARGKVLALPQDTPGREASLRALEHYGEAAPRAAASFPSSFMR